MAMRVQTKASEWKFKEGFVDEVLFPSAVPKNMWLQCSPSLRETLSATFM